MGKIALAVASSGITATLLPGGITAHTAVKIPIDLDNNKNPVCGISHNSDKAKVLQEYSLIVWDECTMAHKKELEAVDRTRSFMHVRISRKDIRRNDHAMGGITVLFCHCRQTLPMVKRGTRPDEVNASMKRSALWFNISKFALTVNMRARSGGNPQAQEFADSLLDIGE